MWNYFKSLRDIDSNEMKKSRSCRLFGKCYSQIFCDLITYFYCHIFVAIFSFLQLLNSTISSDFLYISYCFAFGVKQFIGTVLIIYQLFKVTIITQNFASVPQKKEKNWWKKLQSEIAKMDKVVQNHVYIRIIDISVNGKKDERRINYVF